MNIEKISKFIGNDSLSIIEAMRMIDLNCNGILFLANQEGKILASVTDGDIRRFLIDGGKVTDKVSLAANKDVLVVHSLKDAKRFYHSKDCVAVPVVDDKGIGIDIYTGEDYEPEEKAKLNIPVVINSGGKGTRLDPFTRVLPKPLIPVGKYPILELIIQKFMSYGCDKFHVIVNYKKDIIKAYFYDNELSYDISWYDEEKPLGTGGGLSLLKGKMCETFFFATCDTLLAVDYEEIIKFHKETHDSITMICADKNIKIPYGIVEINADGTVSSMKEKPTLSYLTNTGMYVVEPHVLDNLKEDEPVDFPDIIEDEMKKGNKVSVYVINEREWMDMGELPELEKMRRRLFGDV
ncbi:sugar phosphate nucleotidyltransferase [Oribacterium sp. P6A1]|uniref:sugar phosphate nucleotidyltransferase n=1 Tax=Oribacterium sp. P6A1 TaxID=1410612 RepID=UPI00055BE32C|nr:sugar phosphate nucleotidyltransferase [Oribacterium sp. P6A1]